MKLISNSLLILSFVLLIHSKSVPKFAPEVRPDADLLSLKEKHGLKAVKLTFILSEDTEEDFHCTPTWKGSVPIDDKNIIANISAFHSAGGDVVLVFGGPQGDYLESSCPGSHRLVDAYKHVFNITGAKHMDLDMEEGWEVDPVDNVTQAIAQLQKDMPELTFTLSSFTDFYGLPPHAMVFLASAVDNGVTVDAVNSLMIDFQSTKSWSEHTDEVVVKMREQLKEVWDKKSDEEVSAMMGMTVMIGHSYVGRVFESADAQTLLKYVKEAKIGHLSFRSMDRDNGGCPGNRITDEFCSGLNQTDHEFTKIFTDFDN